MSEVYEATFESSRPYQDPFTDVEVDLLVSDGETEWRVPAFWRGGSRWTVRFRPPRPGTFAARLTNTAADPDLTLALPDIVLDPVEETAPEIVRRGAIRIAASGRHFEHADGTPFRWLGDTWWMGLSDLIPWNGFRELVADRVAKGFTVVQICGGLVPHDEPPTGPGFINEGGASWEPDFSRINPSYFDVADARIAHLVESGIVPAIVGGWRDVLPVIGVPGMKRHWRNLVARWGAYPVIWIVGGEVIDPPEDVFEHRGVAPVNWAVFGRVAGEVRAEGWTEVLRYLREIDPYRHPTTAHEVDPPYDWPVADESLLDFDLFQPGHRGWGSLSTAIAQTGAHYARTSVTRPVVIGEIGYEGIGGQHHADFQRMAYWTTLLNGAAGFSYGTLPLAVGYPEPEARPDHVFRYPDPIETADWREAMGRPGAAQVAMASAFVRTLPWHELRPHPEWVRPRGTTMLHPQHEVRGFDIDLLGALGREPDAIRSNLPAGYWRDADGDARLPYAAGIPRRLRLIYIPGSGELASRGSTTVLGLEHGVSYQAAYWDPIVGVRIPLGPVRRPDDAAVVFTRVSGTGIAEGIELADARVTLDAAAHIDAEVALRVTEEGRVVARHRASEAILEIAEETAEGGRRVLGRVSVPTGARVRLSLETRSSVAAASLVVGDTTVTTEIVDVAVVGAGGATSTNGALEVRGLSTTPWARVGEIPLRDATGRSRGRLGGDYWEGWRKTAAHVLDAYRPPRMGLGQDWVLVLESVGS